MICVSSLSPSILGIKTEPERTVFFFSFQQNIQRANNRKHNFKTENVLNHSDRFYKIFKNCSQKGSHQNAFRQKASR